ncbi:hypothetical protein C0J52_05919 [Blattella germanica]|nr:hypothetical protein C0J52_05919 [Blattella germanica]
MISRHFFKHVSFLSMMDEKFRIVFYHNIQMNYLKLSFILYKSVYYTYPLFIELSMIIGNYNNIFRTLFTSVPYENLPHKICLFFLYFSTYKEIMI